MEPEKPDWSVMRGAIIVFLVSLLASGSLITGAWYYDKQSQAKYNTEKRKFQNISNQYLAVDQEEKNNVARVHPDVVAHQRRRVEAVIQQPLPAVFLEVCDAGLSPGAMYLKGKRR